MTDSPLFGIVLIVLGMAGYVLIMFLIVSSVGLVVMAAEWIDNVWSSVKNGGGYPFGMHPPPPPYRIAKKKSKTKEIKYIRKYDYRVTGKKITPSCEIPSNGDYIFEAVGAGFIAIGDNANISCGTATGCRVSASWGKYGYCGGLMDMSEIKKLRDRLSELIEGAKQ